MKARLLKHLRYKDQVSAGRGPQYAKGTIVPVIPASNLPADSAIKFWIDTPELLDDPYGMGLYTDDFVLV